MNAKLEAIIKQLVGLNKWGCATESEFVSGCRTIFSAIDSDLAIAQAASKFVERTEKDGGLVAWTEYFDLRAVVEKGSK